ncbi:DUF1203 domain-containing protein [Actinopolymorpha sp. B11F2]|uniref:DUF1203 domain-containing protein n=1 Tax=Actinopolymorpha sp. B11F2 TaxID=3160862 RepID=UPI0032E4A2FC
MQPTSRYDYRAIDPDVLGQIRVSDDAGRPPRLLVDESGNNPLRCCLGRSRPGEEIALVSYAPLRRWAAETGAEPGPYDETGPVFIHPVPCAGPSQSGYPVAMGGERRVFRAYSPDGRILGGQILDDHTSEQVELAEEALDKLFADPDVAVVHVRAVEFGCFDFEVRRPPG